MSPISAVPSSDPGCDGDGQGAGRAGDPCRQPRSRSPFLSVNFGAIPRRSPPRSCSARPAGLLRAPCRRRTDTSEGPGGALSFSTRSGETPQEVQASLLRVLEVGEIQPVGGTGRPAGRRAGRRGHGREPGATGPGGNVPRAPPPPARGIFDPAAASAGEARRHRASAGPFPCARSWPPPASWRSSTGMLPASSG